MQLDNLRAEWAARPPTVRVWAALSVGSALVIAASATSWSKVSLPALTLVVSEFLLPLPPSTQEWVRRQTRPRMDATERRRSQPSG